MHPPEGTAKLADFGLATRLAGAPLRSPLDLAATSSSLAFHSLGLGSRGFTPPERLRPLLRAPGVGVGAKEADNPNPNPNPNRNPNPNLKARHRAPARLRHRVVQHQVGEVGRGLLRVPGLGLRLG